MTEVAEIVRDDRMAGYDLGGLLDAVFGPGDGLDPRSRAANSGQTFIRSHTGLAIADGFGGTGLRMSALDAHDAFGWDVLRELALKPAVGIVRSGHLASIVQPRRRRELGLDIDGLARLAGVSVEDVVAVEAGRRRMPMAVLAPLARAMGLCPIRFGAVECGTP